MEGDPTNARAAEALTRMSTPILALTLLVTVLPFGPARAAGPSIGDCSVFPTDNVWNARVDGLPVDPRSAEYVASIGADLPLKADFGAGDYEGAPVGIPFIVVPADQARVPIHYAPFGDEAPLAEESDPGPYPVPADAPIEGGPGASDDRHVLVVQEQSCTLFELYKAVPNADGSWNAVGSARFDLESNELRPEGWTSADAAGLPIFPGPRALRGGGGGRDRARAPLHRAARRARAYVWPARHFASRVGRSGAAADGPALPPQGRVSTSRASRPPTR